MTEIPYGYCQCGCGLKTRLAPYNSTKDKWIKGEPIRFINGHQSRPNDLSAHFWSKVDRSGGESTCWEWLNCINNWGYGELMVNRKKYRAHRFAWELVNGQIPSGLLVLHKCDNPKCCNPKHLFLGTHKDNMKDMAEKGRANPPRLSGEKHGQHKLTLEQVLYIRDRYAKGSITQAELGREMGVSDGAIGDIVTGRNWRT